MPAIPMDQGPFVTWHTWYTSNAGWVGAHPAPPTTLGHHELEEIKKVIGRYYGTKTGLKKYQVIDMPSFVRDVRASLRRIVHDDADVESYIRLNVRDIVDALNDGRATFRYELPLDWTVSQSKALRVVEEYRPLTFEPDYAEWHLGSGYIAKGGNYKFRVLFQQCDRFGWLFHIQRIASNGELMGGYRAQQFVVVKNTTPDADGRHSYHVIGLPRREFGEATPEERRVGPHQFNGAVLYQTAHQAVAWSFGMEPAQYNPTAES